MGIGGISPVQLIIILVIVLLIFGSRKLRNLGGDLGSAVKGFKKAVKEEGSDQESDQEFAPESAPESDQLEVSIAEAVEDEPIAQEAEAEVKKS